MHGFKIFVHAQQSAAHALRQQGIIADPDTLTSFIGPPLHESFPELFGLTEEQTDRAVEDFRVYFSRQGWAENIPYKGMAELLESLQGAGLKLVIATSKPEEFALRIMEQVAEPERQAVNDQA